MPKATKLSCLDSAFSDLIDESGEGAVNIVNDADKQSSSEPC